MVLSWLSVKVTEFVFCCMDCSFLSVSLYVSTFKSLQFLYEVNCTLSLSLFKHTSAYAVPEILIKSLFSKSVPLVTSKVKRLLPFNSTPLVLLNVTLLAPSDFAA